LAARQRIAAMPLTRKGTEILANFKKEYGPEEGERYFYASKNKGTISGVDSADFPNTDIMERLDALMASCDRLDARLDALRDH
jgi:hypothetical protein